MTDGKGDFVYVIKSKFTGKEAGIFEDKDEAEKTLMYLNRNIDAFFITEFYLKKEKTEASK